ncbi:MULTISPECIES: ankyrin repeat domain-containing protein [unclassified Clostridium]|uniref:ankyrin repeat domain-containing protein n=1 Tax=unclassified Clostridium TaxID=2614128 RepID=UPI002079DA4A|nr:MULTISPECIES: ankyrin repeat domain-containing protein [unclassified Clostridium]MBN1039402.1 ankyrin repeat domain-containing protein [Clostridium botulinum]
MGENIKSNSEDIDKKDSRGRTPLINSIVQRKVIDVIESIIMVGANLELIDKLGDTALKKAIKFKRIDVVELLIKHGVNIQSENIADILFALQLLRIRNASFKIWTSIFS